METLKAQYQAENGETTELTAEVVDDVTDVEVVTPEVTE
jgi:hypothetical protein